MLQIEVLKMKQWLKDFVHNCVVHPAMPFLPVKVANWLHDKNANWAFGLERYDELALEGKKKPVDNQLAQLTADDMSDLWMRTYLNLTHYQDQSSEDKKPVSAIRQLAQLLLEDTMNGGPLSYFQTKQWPEQ